MNSAPTTEVPSTDPTLRKKPVAAVAMPTAEAGNSFCTTSTRISKFRPTPKPMTASRPPTTTADGSWSTAMNPTIPATSTAKLTTMSFLYVPSLFTR